MIPLKCYAVLILSMSWLFIGIKQWVFDFPDTSSLIFMFGFFFVGLYVTYDLWFKQRTYDVDNDIRAIDKKCNDLEVKLIDLKNGQKEGKTKNSAYY